MSEGAQWYATIIDHHNYFTDPLFYRYVDFLIQYPALFFLRNFSSHFDVGTTSTVASYILSFGWTFHPIISLFITYRILINYSRKDLFIFPVLSFLAAFMPASAYAVALALPAMSVFWPVFFCVFFAKGKSIKEFVSITILLVGLALCYEPTLIFFMLFIFMAIVDLIWLKEKNRKFNFYLILLCVLLVVFLLYVISTVPDKNTGPFWRSLMHGDRTTRLMGFTVALSVSLILFFNLVAGKFKWLFNTLAMTVFVIGTWYFWNNLQLIYSLDEFEGALGWAYNARSTALPVTWCVATVCWLFASVQRDDKWLSSKASLIASTMVFVTAIATAYMDFRQTNEWNHYFGKFRHFISQSTGCVHVPYESFSSDYHSPTVEPYASAYSSVMAQVLNASSQPIRTLVFVGRPNGSFKYSSVSCPDRREDGSFESEWGSEIFINRGRLIFSKEDLLR